MNLLLELMQRTSYRNAEGVTCNDWRAPLDWAHTMFGTRRKSSWYNHNVNVWLEDLTEIGAVERQDRGEGIVLYRAVIA